MGGSSPGGPAGARAQSDGGGVQLPHRLASPSSAGNGRVTRSKSAPLELATAGIHGAGCVIHAQIQRSRYETSRTFGGQTLRQTGGVPLQWRCGATELLNATEKQMQQLTGGILIFTAVPGEPPR